MRVRHRKASSPADSAGSGADYRVVGGPLDGWVIFRINSEFPPSTITYSTDPDGAQLYQRTGRRYVWRRVRAGR